MSRLQITFKTQIASLAANCRTQAESTTMKRTSIILASVAVFALTGAGADTQTAVNTPGSPTGPYKTITQAEYDQLVQSGRAYVISPTEQANEVQRRQAADARNQAIVNAYIQQNPNSAGLAALSAAPTDPNAVPTGDGNYTIQVPDANGELQTVVTMGQSTLLADLAGSIQAWTDPAQQLSLYASFYSKYASLYSQVCNGVGACPNLRVPSSLTPPSALQNASLGNIHTALLQLATLGGDLGQYLPIPRGPRASCSTEFGASIKATNGTYKGSFTYPPGTLIYGDQTTSSCTAAKANGILKNYNWLNENLLSCVKEQGSRGTCHIFAAISAMEEVIARDTGSAVNLSEQDFNEFVKLPNINPTWGWPESYFQGDGSPNVDLHRASEAGYQFAYENQWDYNPAYGNSKFQYTCDYYPTWLEPGCSDSSPESPMFCTAPPSERCVFVLAPLTAPPSPYQSNGTLSLWADATSFPGVMTANIKIALNVSDAVIWGFKQTPDFHNSKGYVPYDKSVDGVGSFRGSGGHVVHIVGYVDNDTLYSALAAKGVSKADYPAPGAGGGYFIIKNSWGTCSGDLGFYYVPYSYVEGRTTGVWAVETEAH